ncbi:hypothetical protein, conserved [Babesia ovata]|uniref:6-Cys domain-containing protein n=1 Tax=Babesia ovata TaxID=189622 RepID=A0A2H6KD49_9APIC|nr:uncharacterized protein BOVATA_023970 [Babesia ovata]GBE60904.1 hypothetical protein, conserved [Babesia ovata]
MGKFSLRSLWTFGAIALKYIISVDALVCDFSWPNGLLRTNSVVTCDMDIGLLGSASVICPGRVNGTEYILHPQPNAYERAHINVYVSENSKLRSAAIRDVIRSESGNELIWIESTLSQNIMQLHIPTHELFAIAERRLIFICGPRDLVLNDTLQSHLDSLSGFGQMQALPWTSNTPLAHEMSKIGHGIGIFFLYSGSTHLPLQGCGSRPSTLFAPDNVVTVHPVTGVRSCVADPMSKSRIGFLCEGRLEPEDCMKSLLEKDGDVITAPRPYSYLNFSSHRPWVVARYFNDLALPPINGECRCIDPETGHLRARIEIRSKDEYVCDIASIIRRNRLRNIRYPRCSVVLYPGSTLTIRFPIKAVDSASTDDRSNHGLFSQRVPNHTFEAELLPKDLITLRQLSTPYDNDAYDEVLYHRALVGDALELDVSQMARGEVKLKYHVDKPLALRDGLNSFFFHWELSSKNKYVPSRARATVNVSFAFTHHYNIIGCNLETPSVFDPHMSKNCSTKIMGNNIWNTYECRYDMMRDVREVGIYCRPGEELLPNNCESTGYDLDSNIIIPMPVSARNATPYPISGFRVFDMGFHNSHLCFACICVDQSGYERSKLILEYNHHETYRYALRREESSHKSLPYRLLRWKEVAQPIEGFTSPKSLMLYNVTSHSIELHIGTTLFMYCEIETEGTTFDQMENAAENKYIAGTWLPKQPNISHYYLHLTPDGPELIRRSHKDNIIGTPGGFQVVYDNSYTAGYHRLMIVSRRGAILISKDTDNTEYVPVIFVCGKAPKPSDLFIVAGNASTLNLSSQPTPHIVGSSERYNWHVVELAVHTTDPYMQGCGVTYASDELFKPETPPLYDGDGKSQFGCKIDLQAAKEAAFYCPAPYVLDPPNCFSQVSVDGEVRNLSDLSKPLVASRSNHFVILSFDSSLVGPGETLHQTPPLECRCLTIKGVVLSTIQIENYYAKE